MNRFLHIAVVGTLASLLLAGCATTTTAPSSSPEIEVPRNASKGIERMLLEAERSEPPRSTELRLDVASEALKQGDVELLRRILDAIITPYYNRRTTRDYSLLKAELAVIDGDPRGAIALLNHQRFISLPLTTDLQVKTGLLRAKAYAAGRSYLASAREIIYIDNLVDPEQRERNHEQIYQTLLQLDAATLAKQAEQSITSDIRGWLSLAAVAKRYEHDPLRQLNALNDWMKAWPNHPAAIRVPETLRLLSEVVSEQPKHVALLLPLQGELGKFGRAVRDGFIAAHFDQSPETTLSIFDTSERDVVALVDEAFANGAELIVGPLDRERVTALAAHRLPLPVIALNRTLDNSINPNLYQFGLSPEDESVQVATQVVSESRYKGLVIAPDTEWGDRNVAAFTDQFTMLGGIIVDSARFTSQRDYSDMIKSLLNVDSSEARVQDLQRITGERFQFTPRRRQDIDFVFLLSNPLQARGINPTLAFFYAEDIPVYATSHVHELGESRIDVIDMNGIRFCDIPWKLTSSDETQNAIQAIWPEASSQMAPFYALGLDVHRLYPRLQQLKEIENERIYGSTGILTLDEENVVKRTLMWAQFRDGEVESVPMIFDVAAGR